MALNLEILKQRHAVVFVAYDVKGYILRRRQVNSTTEVRGRVLS